MFLEFWQIVYFLQAFKGGPVINVFLRVCFDDFRKSSRFNFRPSKQISFYVLGVFVDTISSKTPHVNTQISREDIPIPINILYIAVHHYTISLMGNALTCTFFSYPVLNLPYCHNFRQQKTTKLSKNTFCTKFLRIGQIYRQKLSVTIFKK